MTSFTVTSDWQSGKAQESLAKFLGVSRLGEKLLHLKLSCVFSLVCNFNMRKGGTLKGEVAVALWVRNWNMPGLTNDSQCSAHILRI
jgi:hypothetical protein